MPTANERDDLVLKLSDDSGLSLDDLKRVEEADKAFRAARVARLNTIDVIREVADKLDAVQLVENSLSIGGNATAILGSTATIASAIVTAGAAIPFLVSTLLWTGFGLGVAGAGMKVGGTIYSTPKQKELMEELRDTLKEDMESNSELRIRIRELERPAFLDRKFIVCKAIALFNPVTTGPIVYSHVYGGKALAELVFRGLEKITDLKVTNPAMNMLVKTVLSGMSNTVVEGMTVTVEAAAAGGAAGEIAIEAVKDIADGPTKKIAYHMAKVAAEEVIKKGGNETAKLAAQQSFAVLSARLMEAGGGEAWQRAMEALKNIDIAGGFTNNIGFNMAKVVAEEAIKDPLREETAKLAAQKFTQRFAVPLARLMEAGGGEAWQRAMEAAKDIADTRKIAYHMAKVAAEEAIKEGGEETAKIAAQKATQSIVTHSASIMGGVTIGLGVFSIAWDSFLIYKQLKKESLADGLNKIAREMEEKLTKT